jgi:hypothetical protein
MEGITYAGVDNDESFSPHMNINGVIEASKELAEIVAVVKPRVVLMGGSDKAYDGDLNDMIVRRSRKSCAQFYLISKKI